jgi:hypothetical protein
MNSSPLAPQRFATALESFSARVCELSRRMCRMRTDSCRRAVPERLIEEEKASENPTLSVARPGQRSESRALDVDSDFDQSVDSCFLVSARSNVCVVQTDKAAKGSRIWRSRYHGAHRPLDRRLCVATFRWFCLCQNRAGRKMHHYVNHRRDESLTVVERARLEPGTTLFHDLTESVFSRMC